MFYPDVKPHISPSALSTWHSGKGAFIKSYFDGEKSGSTLAMKAGSKIHKMIEGGLLTPLKIYDQKEKRLQFEVVEGIMVLGIPDSHEEDGSKDTIEFVDYKTGKDRTWDAVKLATDLKMKTTAWLVWQANPQAKTIIGHLNFIQTKYDEDETDYIPTGFQEVIDKEYTVKELKAFTKVIEKTIKEVNKAYGKWADNSSEFINEADVIEYYDTHKRIEAMKEDLNEIGVRIHTQMELGNIERHKSNLGTFYFVSRKKYEYPTSLKVFTANFGEVNFDNAIKIHADTEAAIKSAKQDYEKSHEPVTTTRSLAYRPLAKGDKI